MSKHHFRENEHHRFGCVSLGFYKEGAEDVDYGSLTACPNEAQRLVYQGNEPPADVLGKAIEYAAQRFDHVGLGDRLRLSDITRE